MHKQFASLILELLNNTDMKLFQFNYQDEYCDYYAANNINEAIQFAQKSMGLWDEDIEKMTITEVPEAFWADLFRLEQDRDWESYYEDGYIEGFKIIESFSTFMKRVQNPCFIDTHEFNNTKNHPQL